MRAEQEVCDLGDVKTRGETAGHDEPGLRASALRFAKKGYARVLDAVDEATPTYRRLMGSAFARVTGGPFGALRAVAVQFPFTPEEVLLGYTAGLFPTVQDGRHYWESPDPRSVLMLEKLRIPSRVRTYINKGLFEFAFDRDPAAVVHGCANREHSWLTPTMQSTFLALHELGAMHTVEARKGGQVVGGAFGLAIGSVFTLESMFSAEDHASKLAFAFLGKHLAARKFSLIDCQFHKATFAQFGAEPITRLDYRSRLARGLVNPPSFLPERSRHES